MDLPEVEISLIVSLSLGKKVSALVHSQKYFKAKNLAWNARNADIVPVPRATTATNIAYH